MEEEQPAEEGGAAAEHPPAEVTHGESEGAPPSSEAMPPGAGGARPSKSSLVLEKRASALSKSLSRVRLVEPAGEVQPSEEVERRKSREDERRKSDAERRKSDAERRGSEAKRRKSEAERRQSENERRKSDAERRRSETERRPSETAERRRSDAEKLSRQQSVGSAPGYQGSRAGSLKHSMSTSASREGVMRRRSDSPSKAKSAIGSTISIRRTSGYGEYFGGARVAKYMNTYKLDSDNPFQVEKVQKILRDVLTEALDNLTYDPDKCPKQAKWASSAIRAKVKEQEYDRYKLVIIVTIGEKRYQDMCSVVRFLWDIERDKYALFVHENMHVYAAAMCFALYYE